MDEIIKRFREGNQRAFEELFWGFFSAGRQFVKSFQVDDSSADDILQEVFIHIWDKRQAFKNEDHFKAYFYKALRNNTVKYITRNKHVLNLESAENKESDDVLLKITEIEFNREISRAVSLLPEKRREIILLSMSGMSEQMIADTLNISINTVKNQKTKAYASLRQELKDISSFVLLLGL